MGAPDKNLEISVSFSSVQESWVFLRGYFPLVSAPIYPRLPSFRSLSLVRPTVSSAERLEWADWITHVAFAQSSFPRSLGGHRVCGKRQNDDDWGGQQLKSDFWTLFSSLAARLDNMRETSDETKTRRRCDVCWKITWFSGFALHIFFEDEISGMKYGALFLIDKIA